MIRAVLFDYEGVVAAKGSHLLSEHLGRNLGIPAKQAWEELLAPEQHNSLTGAINETELWQNIGKRYGKPIDASARDIWHSFEELKLYPEVIAFAEHLRRKGITAGILSNVITVTRDSVQSRNGYTGFEPVFLSCEIGFAKPDEAVYEFVLEKLERKPDEVLFVDDREDNVAAAERLGIYAILATSPKQVIADATRLISELNGIDL